MSTSFEPGTYKATITDHGLTESKEKKTPALYFKVRIDPGSQERTIYKYLTDRTVAYVVEDMERLGVVVKSWNEFDRDSGTVDLVGQEVEVYCEHSEYDGELYEKWNLSRGATALPPVSADAKQKRQMSKLDALLGKAIKGKTLTNGKKPIDEQPAEQPVQTATEDDDLPF